MLMPPINLLMPPINLSGEREKKGREEKKSLKKKEKREKKKKRGKKKGKYLCQYWYGRVRLYSLLFAYPTHCNNRSKVKVTNKDYICKK